MTNNEQKVFYYLEIGYHLPNEEKNFVKKLKKDVEDIILHDLPEDMKNIFGKKVKTEILTTRTGSLIVYFAAIIMGYNIIANYEDFFSSAQLIKKHCKRLIRRILYQKYEEITPIVEVSIEYPSLPEPRYETLPKFSLPRKEFNREFGGEFPDIRWPGPAMIFTKRRDDFFYFLLVLSITSLIIIGLLVYSAVVRTYFLP